MRQFNRFSLCFLALGMVLTIGGAGLARADADEARIPARPRFPISCILKLVAQKKSIRLRSDVEVPPLLFQSETTLEEFKAAIEPQWHIIVEKFTNAYVIRQNRIFILDEADYYERVHRSVDDSIAHELSHFLQVKYQGYDLDQDFTAEDDAVEVQTWFRENFIFTNRNPVEVCSSVN